MRDYVIFVDSACDISCDLLNEWGVRYCSLSLAFSDDVTEHQDHEISKSEFYNKMRSGAIPKTSAANMGKFCDAFEAIANEEKDISVNITITETMKVMSAITFPPFETR